METALVSVKKEIEKAKTKLIKKAQKKGYVWENFGQDEVRKIREKYCYTPQYLHTGVFQEINAFEMWAMDYNV